MMTVAELIARLSDLPPDAEVRLATQPSYPFENSIAGVNCAHPDQAEIERMADELAGSACGDGSLTEVEQAQVAASLAALQERPEVVYILEGTQLGYASRDLWYV